LRFASAIQVLFCLCNARAVLVLVMLNLIPTPIPSADPSVAPVIDQGLKRARISLLVGTIGIRFEHG
jgi:hypothetical protein